MKTQDPHRAVVVLSPVDGPTLAGLEVAEGFAGSQDGGPARVQATLHALASSTDDRLAIGLTDGATIVGYMSTRTPAPGTRLYSVVPAAELAAFEVAKPYRRHGVFTTMFNALFRRHLEESIIYVVADPERRERRESTRGFRDRLEGVLGSVGFVPLPTDERELHPHTDSTLFVRVGRGVPTPDVEDFFKRLRTSAYASVAIALREMTLRNAVRDYLERNGFRVTAVSSGRPLEPADVVITDGEGRGRDLTVRLNGGVEVHSEDGTLWYPSMDLSRLPGVLRAELEQRRAARV